MSEGSIADSSSISEDTRVKSPSLTMEKMDNLPPFPIIRSNDDDEVDDDISYQFTEKEDVHEISSVVLEKFFDAAVQLDSTDLSVSESNMVSLYGSKSPRNNEENKRNLFLCCFCPPDGSDDPDDDSEDSFRYKNILDFAGCNVDKSDLLFDVEDGDEDIISSDNILESQGSTFDATSTIHESDFLSCCDTIEFDFDSKFLDSPKSSLVDKPFKAFSRHIRVCNLNVHDMRAMETNLFDEEVETTMDSSQTSTTVKNVGLGEEESIEAVLSTPSMTNMGVQGPKLTFLELTNRYDGESKSNEYHATVIQAMNDMTRVGLNVATGGAKSEESNTISVSWKEEGSTNRLLNKLRSGNDSKWYSNPDSIRQLETDTLVWSGYSEATTGEDSTDLSTYGAKVPYFKARGIIPHISPVELAELILDSSRVKMYNKWTCGRDDLHIFQESMSTVNGLYGDGCLKVVESKTAIPFSSNTLKMVNFLHARPLKVSCDDLCNNDEDIEIDCSDTPNAYIIVSRSIYTEEEVSKDESNNITQAKPGSKNEMILGVNVFREIPGHPGKTDMLTVSQANSSAIPSFLSHKAGLMGATDFIKSLRSMKSNDM